MAFGQLRAPISGIRSNSYAGLGGRVLTDPTGERRKRQFRQRFRGLQSCRPNSFEESGCIIFSPAFYFIAIPNIRLHTMNVAIGQDKAIDMADVDVVVLTTPTITRKLRIVDCDAISPAGIPDQDPLVIVKEPVIVQDQVRIALEADTGSIVGVARRGILEIEPIDFNRRGLRGQGIIDKEHALGLKHLWLIWIGLQSYSTSDRF